MFGFGWSDCGVLLGGGAGITPEDVYMVAGSGHNLVLTQVGGVTPQMVYTYLT